MAEWTFGEKSVKNYCLPPVWGDHGINDLLEALSEESIDVKPKLFDWDKSLGFALSKSGKKTGIIIVYDSIGQNLVREHGIEPVMLPLDEKMKTELIKQLKTTLES